MKVAFFSTKPYDRQFFDEANAAAGHPHRFLYLEAHLNLKTVPLAEGAAAVCPFVNDEVDRDVLACLARTGTRLIAIRGAGFNNVDILAAERLGILVARVPAYSPHAVAEHAVALMLTLNRKTHRAFARVREGNFSLDGLLGFDLHGRTVGIIGTGRIGMALARILTGFGCKLLGNDPFENDEFRSVGGSYVALDVLLSSSEIISLHCPLTPETHHLIDSAAIERMRNGVMLINTSRGDVIDTRAVIDGLKSGRLGYLGLDVYEEEADLFFEDLSDRVISDDVFARLLTFANVLITGHQGFFTRDAMQAIASSTIANISQFERTGRPLHEVTARQVGPAAERTSSPILTHGGQ